VLATHRYLRRPAVAAAAAAAATAAAATTSAAAATAITAAATAAAATAAAAPPPPSSARAAYIANPPKPRTPPQDTFGNGRPGGRYFLVPGSSGRAAEIAQSLTDVTVRPSSRGHDVHLGKLDGEIDVGVVSSGMGCPSVDIILTEMIRLGGKRFLRVGSAGSLQPAVVKVGSLVIATGAVRDEGTSKHYAPLEFPAMASPKAVTAMVAAAGSLGVSGNTFAGIIHSKDSLMAREFHEGYLVEENLRYMNILKSLGVLASEMEASHMYTLGAVHGGIPSPVSSWGVELEEVHMGCVLGVVGADDPFADADDVKRAIDGAMELSLESVRQMHKMESEEFSGEGGH